MGGVRDLSGAIYIDGLMQERRNSIAGVMSFFH